MFQYLYLFSVLFIVEYWYNTVFTYSVPFLPHIMWYNRGERRLFNPPSACLCFKYFQTNVINSITIYIISVSLLPRTLRISYMIGVYMEWSPKQHARMYYILNTHHRRCDRDMMILMTETSRLNGTVAYDEGKRRSDIINKISNHQRIHPLLCIFAIRSDISWI